MVATPETAPKVAAQTKRPSWFAAIRARLAASVDTRDVHVYSGAMLLSVGFGFVYWPLAFIVPGAILVYIGLFWGEE